jgi:Fe-S-cluster-containing dehydrogenase component/DMSO reductase anchor subunit
MMELAVANQKLAADEAVKSLETPPDELVAMLLGEQQSLTATDRFSRWHDTQERRGGDDGRTPSRYQSLLPATPPAAGQQYAFEVDLDRCSGCKSCVVACHTLNGLDEGETWRDVGLLVGGSRSLPVLQHVTATCHHCLEPACMIACPVNAYEKDPATGIVKNLDDQCIGCQYCTMACPYEVPQYHAAKGIVRKCDMCSARLAVGEPPACVQACPHEAIAIRIVGRDEVREDAEGGVFLPAAPDPQITLPTTTYRSRRPFPRNLLPADYFRAGRQHAHFPLVVMLVLTQLSVGAFVSGFAIEPFTSATSEPFLLPLHALSSLIFGLLAIGASVFHLGRPRYAFRAVLGLRHSWLSREIVAFGAFAIAAIAYAIAALAAHRDVSTRNGWEAWAESLGAAVAVSGVAGVFCSVMVYVFPRRECWSIARVAIKFTVTSILLGVAAVMMGLFVATLVHPSPQLMRVAAEHGPLLCRALTVAALAKLVYEAAVFRHLLSGRMTPLKRSALLLAGELSGLASARFAAGALGGIVMPLFLWQSLAKLSTANVVQFTAASGVLFVACLAGELLERCLFFSACAASRMPGGIR